MKLFELLDALSRFVPYMSTISEAIETVKLIKDKFGDDIEITDELIQAERAKLRPAPPHSGNK